MFGVLAGAAIAGFGALVLGEYPYTGLLVVASGALLGLFVAEGAIAASRRRGMASAVVCAVLAAAGMVWGGWISTGHDLGQVAGWGWAAVGTAPVVAAVRAAWRTPARSRPEPTPSE